MRKLNIRWVVTFCTLLTAAVLVYAQNPVSISQVGTTAVGTTLPISAAALPLPAGAATSGLQTTINTTLGSPFQAGGSIGNTSFGATQATAANLNATVVGTGTFATQVTTVPADPFGVNADAASATGSISAKLRFIASTGIPVTNTVTVASHAVTNAGTFAVQEADGANTVLGSKADAKSTATDTTAITIMQVLKQISASVQGTLTVGSHAVTNAGTFAVQPTANAQVDVNKWNGQALASPDANSYVIMAKAATATTTAGTSTCYFPSAASNNAQFCKASAGNLYAIHVTNTTTTNYFLRLYNLTAAPTCSSATGFVETIPALGAAANGGVNGRVNDPPQAFTTGIAFCMTGGSSSTDNTNAATGVTITLLYK